MDTFSILQLAGPSRYGVLVELSQTNVWLSCGLHERVTALAHLIATTTWPPNSPKTVGCCTTGALFLSNISHKNMFADSFSHPEDMTWQGLADGHGTAAG